jgi:hypothetical protein
MQKYSSANTSLNQVPALVKHLSEERVFLNGMVVLDYGGGKYDKTKEYVEAIHGVSYNVYDPYNRSEEQNNYALDSKYDIIMLSNVLNVVREPQSRSEIIQLCRLLLLPEGRIYIRTYQAPKSNLYQEKPYPGQPTKQGTCWQNCKPLSHYLPEVQRLLRNSVINKGIIEAKL